MVESTRRTIGLLEALISASATDTACESCPPAPAEPESTASMARIERSAWARKARRSSVEARPQPSLVRRRWRMRSAAQARVRVSRGSVKTTSVRWSAVASAIVRRWLHSRKEIASKSGVQALRSVIPMGFRPK